MGAILQVMLMLNFWTLSSFKQNLPFKNFVKVTHRYVSTDGDHLSPLKNKKVKAVVTKKTKTKKQSELTLSESSSVKSINIDSKSTSSRSMNVLLPSQSQFFQASHVVIETLECHSAHSSVSKWIVFSDLHVRGSSIETCEQVLHEVHTTALQRNAGIIFLGDFWHVRGSLNVELLNRVLVALRKWSQPVIMIPGNHDQVTLGGHIHSLEPLKYAFDKSQIMLISEPSIFLGALWIPYRRSSAVMKQILSQASQRNDISMIFCHVDIRGAYMNDNIQSQEGLEVTDFPVNIPTYTGHFHKPHTIIKNNCRVRYCGSPYQTSLSEAGQQKYLYCLSNLPESGGGGGGGIILTSTTITDISSDSTISMENNIINTEKKKKTKSTISNNIESNSSSGSTESSSSSNTNGSNRLVWKEVEKIVIDVGRKYYKASIHDKETLNKLKSGDKLVLYVKVGEEYDADQLVLYYKNMNVEVELRHEGYKKIKNKTTSTTTTMNGVDNAVDNNIQSEGKNDNIGDNDDVQEEKEEEITDITDLNETTNPIQLFKYYMISGGYDDILMKSLASNSSNTITYSTTNSEKNTSTKKKSKKNHTTTVSNSLLLDEENDENVSSAVTVEIDKNMTARTQLYQSVMEEGISTLERLQNTIASTPTQEHLSIQKIHDLQLSEVVLTNFGPYGGDTVSYPLSKRGLVLITAESSDGTGADSNGAGKTTLAMSVLWGLTGTMDPRLAGDSKASDIRYDDGKGDQNKRIAEICIRGSINGDTFEVIRKRWKSKSELYFTVNDRDYTTLAVKDTQAHIDTILGISNDILHRCCFFGQHSHTMNSLLGLSDLKFKSEMSVLVDTHIWNLALQDVRLRERTCKSRINEILIEKRMKNDEKSRIENEVNKVKSEYTRILSQYDEAKIQYNVIVNTSQQGVTAMLGNQSIHDLQQEIASNMNKYNQINLLITPLRNDILQANKNRTLQLKKYDDAILQVKEKIAQTKAVVDNETKNIRLYEQKRLQIESDIRKIQAILNEINVKLQTQQMVTVDESSHIVLLEQQKKEFDVLKSQITLLDMKLNTLKISLSRINELIKQQQQQQQQGSSILSSQITTSNTTDNSCHTHRDNDCPTCGQVLPQNMTLFRQQELSKDIQEVSTEKDNISKQIDRIKIQIDFCTKYKDNYSQLKLLKDRLNEVVSDKQNTEKILNEKSTEMNKWNTELNTKVSEKQTKETELVQEETNKVTQLKTYENDVKEYQDKEKQLKQKLDEIKALEQTSTQKQTSANATLTILRDRLTVAETKVAQEEALISQVNQKLQDYNEESKHLTQQSIVLNRLNDILGTKGIQQFLYMTIIKQLEDIANHYLVLLANNGINLSLQGEWDSEKIIKKVLIRSLSSGEYHERGLAQLSGGQYRRVSLALDLAFAELIRRKGLLRCNLMVMDEILTHLDASGREAVGSVLRALVSGHKKTVTQVETETDNSNNNRNNLLTKTDVSSSSISMSNSNNNTDLQIVDNGDESRLLSNTLSSNNFDPLDMSNISRNTDMSSSSSLSSSNQVSMQHLFASGSYETVLVILQDLSALEMEEAFDHIDIVKKVGDTSTVIIDGAT